MKKHKNIVWIEIFLTRILPHEINVLQYVQMFPPFSQVRLKHVDTINLDKYDKQISIKYGKMNIIIIN